jgi:hypothetical protein
MEQRNLEEALKRICSRLSELPNKALLIRQASETLGVPEWCYEAAASAYDAAVKLRAAEALTTADAMTADALKHHAERLAPVMDGHPEMTIGEAERLLKAQTDAAVRELEDSKN